MTVNKRHRLLHPHLARVICGISSLTCLLLNAARAATALRTFLQCIALLLVADPWRAPPPIPAALTPPLDVVTVVVAIAVAIAVGVAVAAGVVLLLSAAPLLAPMLPFGVWLWFEWPSSSPTKAMRVFSSFFSCFRPPQASLPLLLLDLLYDTRRAVASDRLLRLASQVAFRFCCWSSPLAAFASSFLLSCHRNQCFYDRG